MINLNNGIIAFQGVNTEQLKYILNLSMYDNLKKKTHTQ